MNSFADVLARAGVVSEDEAAVAKRLKRDIETAERELRYLRNPKRVLRTEDDQKKINILEARLRVLRRTKVIK